MFEQDFRLRSLKIYKTTVLWLRSNSTFYGGRSRGSWEGNQWAPGRALVCPVWSLIFSMAYRLQCLFKVSDPVAVNYLYCAGRFFNFLNFAKKCISQADISDACIYHPGPAYFHDAYKIWNCCNKKSTDFGTWLSFKGCTRGRHNGEKPVEETAKPIKVETKIRPEAPEEVSSCIIFLFFNSAESEVFPLFSLVFLYSVLAAF